MSSAFYETKGKLRGTPEERAEMMKVLLSYTDGVKDAYFMNPSFDTGEEETSFSAQGPYGKFDDLNDVDVFREMAQAAPTAAFEADVEGEDSYSESELHCNLQNGILTIETSCTVTEDEDRAYLEYVTGKMPYEKFIALYGIEPDSLPEDDYEDFVNDLIIDYGEEEYGPFDLEYGDFVTCLENYGGEITLDGEAYEPAREQMRQLGIQPVYDFNDNSDSADRKSYRFDAMTGQYIR